MAQVISSLKEEILHLKDENANTVQRIRSLEKYVAEISTEDSFSDQEEEFTEKCEKGPLLNKCEKCEFVCEREINMNKHMNTNHFQEESNKRLKVLQV